MQLYIRTKLLQNCIFGLQMGNLTINIDSRAGYKIMEDMIMPAIVRLPTVVEDALGTFGPLFPNEPERKHFAEYLTGLIIANKKTSPLSIASLLWPPISPVLTAGLPRLNGMKRPSIENGLTGFRKAPIPIIAHRALSQLNRRSRFEVLFGQLFL